VAAPVAGSESESDSDLVPVPSERGGRRPGNQATVLPGRVVLRRPERGGWTVLWITSAGRRQISGTPPAPLSARRWLPVR